MRAGRSGLRSRSERREKIGRSDVQCRSQAHDVHQRDVSLPTLGASHIRPIDASLRRKLLLGEAGALAVLAQVIAKSLQDFFSGEGAHDRAIVDGVDA